MRRLEKVKMPKRQEQRPSSLIDAMDSGEGQYVTRKNIDHALELKDTVYLPPVFPHAVPPLSLSWYT